MRQFNAQKLNKVFKIYKIKWKNKIKIIKALKKQLKCQIKKNK
jgi:hypothetical protein